MARQTRKSDPDNGLTPIHSRIHCAATTDAGGNDELEQIQVDHFLHTLAKIAIAVAARQAGTSGSELG